MLFIVGRIADRIVVETADKTSDVDIEAYKEAIAKNYTGIKNDYSILMIDKGDPAFERIHAGDEWTPVWTGSSITSVDFTVYDAKYLLAFESDKTEIIADGNDSCTITVRLIDPLDTALFEDLSGVNMPVQSPLNQCVKKVDIMAGSTKFDFHTTIAGTWKFPMYGVKMIGDYRIKNQITINALLA
jgi:hypothetical protein